MTEQHLPLESGQLAYQHGGSGPLVIFSHGLGPLAWGSLERLRGSCTVAIPDWERSTVPANTMRQLDWFATLANSLGFQQAALCAWSMAGPVALYFAASRPTCLSHLILVDVAGLGDGLPPLKWRDLPHLILTRLLGHPSRGFVRALWKSWTHHGTLNTKPLEDATYRFFRDKVKTLEEPTDDEEDLLLDVLPQIEVPTLVLSGRHSTVLGPRHGRTATALLPHGQHLIFEESSHALQLEEPDKFQDALAAFVSGAPTG
jgi:pimeloyl-ACP methyl ester carboxylesterase